MKATPKNLTAISGMVGRKVRVTSPRYYLLDPKDEGRVIQGVLLATALRENGEHAGRILDLVIDPGSGKAVRTINVSRIVNIEAVA